MKDLRVLDERIGLKHGAGGRAMRVLIEEVFAKGATHAAPDGIGLSALDLEQNLHFVAGFDIAP